VTVEVGPAVFSENRVYRYNLTRKWDEDNIRGSVNFIMLNPSTADEQTLDPTLRRCARYAMDWGYGGMSITNLFAYRATDPRAMKAASDPVGPENDDFIVRVAQGAGLVVVGWGSHGDWMRRDLAVKKLLRDAHVNAYALKVTGTGQPGHPLYLRRDAELVRFDLSPGVRA
jgi:hypothetical protein